MEEGRIAATCTLDLPARPGAANNLRSHRMLYRMGIRSWRILAVSSNSCMACLSSPMRRSNFTWELGNGIIVPEVRAGDG